MTEKKLTIGAAALVAVIATAGFVGISSAYQGDPSVQGPNVDTETHEAMLDAFENKDYEAWLANKPSQGKGRMMDVVNNQENFEKFVEIREARLAGNTEKADELRAELGLGLGQGMHGDLQGLGKKGRGMRGQGQGSRGQNMGGHFVDADGDGVCDLME